MDMLSYFLGRLANGEGGGGNGPIYIGGVLYTNIEYKDNNTVILTEEGGTQHIIRCIYSEDKIQTLYYDEVEISLTYDDEGELIKIGDTIVDMSIAPTNSGGTEVIEQLIDESGVLDTEGTVTEKVEQLIDKAETDKLLYDMSTRVTSINDWFYQSNTVKEFPKGDYSKVTNANGCFNTSTLEKIDFYLDLASCITASMMFANTPNLKQIKGVNTSKMSSAQNMFQNSAIEVVEMPLDFTAISKNANKSNFDATPNLREIRFKEGCLFYHVAFNSFKLSAESIHSIIDGLATVTTAQTLTLNSAIVLTDEQKATIKSKGWTLVQ